ncbi:MAG: alpha/beta hydrolase [Spirochaetales bacterium]|nr:alpha/beta hydrolase [Spirochaetales bacterium]
MRMELDGADIYYEEFGEGIPLLFLHGYHIDHKCFSCPVEERMGGLDGFRRIYPDLPGMGLTELKRPVDSTEELFSLLMAFIDRITEGKPFALAGYSYGGYVARGVLRARYRKIRGMFLLCPVIVPDRRSRILPDFHVLEKDFDFLESLALEDREIFGESCVIQNEEVFRKFKKEIAEPFLLADRTMLKNLQRQAYAFEEPVDNLNLNFEGPVHFLAGRQDSIVGYEDIYSIFNDYPKGELSVLNGAGHNLQIEREEEFGRLLKQWAEKVRAFRG